jgi:hypothetical protein
MISHSQHGADTQFNRKQARDVAFQSLQLVVSFLLAILDLSDCDAHRGQNRRHDVLNDPGQFAKGGDHQLGPSR